MSEVGQTDLSRLLLTKRSECNAIVTSRKRKLRELFAVATHVEGLPHDGFTKVDAPATTQAEADFLQANDILQGKKLNEIHIPSRREIRLEALQQSLAQLENGNTYSLPKSPALVASREAHRLKQATKPTPDPKPGHASTSTPPPPPSLPSATNAPSALPVEPKAKPVSPVPLPKQASTSQVTPPIDKTKQPVPSPTPVPTPVSKPSSVSLPSVQTNASPQPTLNTISQKRQPQVSFQSDVKVSSPSVSSGQEKQEVQGKSQTSDATTSKDPRTAPPVVKVPTDSLRAPDALSSPGSTAPSATTPGGVHDRSTDTSPDHEGPTYTDAESKVNNDDGPKTQDEQPDDTPKPSATVDETAEESQESAEAQLLQESSTAAVISGAVADTTSIPAVADNATSEPTKDSSVVEEEKESIDLDKRKQSASDDKPEPEVEEKAQDLTASVEIPDSREDTPDPMDIDTSDSTSKDKVENEPGIKEPEKPISQPPATPVVEKATPKETSQGPERAVTRVSSGALKPKSVNEIVGGTSRPPPSTATHSPSVVKDHVDDQLTPLTSTSQSPTSRPRRISSVRKDKSKGQVSAVLFGKQSRKGDETALVSGSKEAIHPSDDYYTPLFVQGFAGSSSWMQPLEKVLFHANKTVATPDVNLCIQDHQACKVLRRVYHLQSNDKWSLRQLKRSAEPTRPPSHWDVVLQEAKWMRTDFREERKWKMTAARNLANACADWCVSSPEDRKAMQVQAFIPPKVVVQDDVSMAGDGGESQPTPDLVPGDTESPQVVDELVEVFQETIPPSAIFTLQDDDVVFGLRRTAAADQLLEELPIFGAPLKVPRPDLVAPDYDPDAHWRRPALPLSKYVEGHMKLASEGPPRKRSRYNYRNDDSDDEGEGGLIRDTASQKVEAAPESSACALFNPEMKHIRDRLHAGHQFRPPTDHPMPMQSFYESRNPSMWTHAEDDELRGLVRDYSYNWPLISSMLLSKSMFSSGAERRTPWECFERWIQLEGLPSDMQKTQYFRAYNSRIEAAQRFIAQQNAVAAQQASANGATGPPFRRRQSTPLRVERRRQQKHLTLLDAMRKLAKKREAALQKQQHAASQNAANKKPEAVAQRPGSSKTPKDYSLLRWERDQALAEKMAAFAHRQDATRRAALLQARSQTSGQRTPGPGGPAGQNGHTAGPVVNGANGGPRPNNAVQAAAMGNHARSRMPMAPPGQVNNAMGGAGAAQLPNGLVPPVPINGSTPQAQMQGLQAQQRVQMPNHQQPNANLMMRAQQISEQQRVAVQMQQAQHQHQHINLQQQLPHSQGGAATPRPPSQHNSPPNVVNGVAINGVNGVNGMNQQNYMNNAQALMAQFNSTNGGHSSPPASMHMTASSPRSMSQMQIPPALANQINHFEQQFRAKNPNLTPEQARQLATEHLARAMAAQRQNAMNAAAGATGQHGIANSIAATTSPHQYAALLRSQQQQQQAQQAQQQQQHLQHASGASQAASSPGQLSHASHPRQSSEGATPSAG